MADLYPDFATLAAMETYGIDYRIRVESRSTSIVVLAPHGGWIEPGTSSVAAAIAREDYSSYVFEGLRRRPHSHLLITSTRFDEPRAVKLIGAAETVIAIHGRADDGDPSTILLGGRNIALRDVIAASLEAAGFEVAPAPPGMTATDHANICNRGVSGRGVQLELPRTLRTQLMSDSAPLDSFSDAVREAIFLQQKLPPGR